RLSPVRYTNGTGRPDIDGTGFALPKQLDGPNPRSGPEDFTYRRPDAAPISAADITTHLKWCDNVPETVRSRIVGTGAVLCRRAHRGRQLRSRPLFRLRPVHCRSSVAPLG